MNCPSCKTDNPEGTKYCLSCGAPLTNALGTPQPQAQPMTTPTPQGMQRQPVQLKTSGMAIASLVLGLTTLCTFGVTGIVGIILGIVALVQIGQPRSHLKGNGLAAAGIGLSIVLPVLMVIASFSIFHKALPFFQPMIKPTVEMGLCVNNERVLATQAQMYAQDHQGVYPTNEQFWKENFTPPTAIYCPTKGQSVIGYGYYQSIAGKSVSSSASPGTQPLLADGGNASHQIMSKADIAHRHMSGYNLAYADGHVESLEVVPPTPGQPSMPLPTPTGQR